MQKLLNQREADKAKPAAKPYQLHDTAIPGLVLRVQPTGTKLWKLIQGRKPRTLGRSPVMTYAMAAEKATAILRGEDPDAPTEPEHPARPMTFGDFLEGHYAAFLEANHSNPTESRQRIERFGLQDKVLAEIRLADVETWRTKRQQDGRKPSTINRDLAVLRRAFHKAVDWELLDSNPLARLKPLREDRNPVIRYLSDTEDARLKGALKRRDDTLREQRERGNQWRRERGYELLPELGEYADNLTPLVLMALGTGLRRTELWRLKWGDVDLVHNSVAVHGSGTKSRQIRHVPLNAAVQAVLKVHRGPATPLPHIPVFGRHEFRKSFNTVLEDARIEKFRFHDCRHTFASRLVMRGVPLNTVRELLGHADIKMTLRYAHLAPDTLRQAVELLP